jgi:putative transposase
MFSLFFLWIRALISLFRNRRNLVLENLVLRQQLAVLKRRHPRPNLGLFDKLFWVVVRRFWSEWKQALIVVTPETVVRWHRTGFRMYWRLISRVRAQVERKGTPKVIRELRTARISDSGRGRRTAEFVR